MQKQFNNLITTLTIVYLALVFLVGIAIYALVIEFCLDITLTTNILIWSATIFAPLAILATYNSWKDQKGNEVLSFEAIKIAKMMNSLLPMHRNLFWYSPFKNPGYEDELIKFIFIYDEMNIELSFLKDALENIYEIDEYEELNKAQDLYLKSMFKLKEEIYSIKFYDEHHTIPIISNSHFDTYLDDYAKCHHNLYNYLLRISTFKTFNNMNLK